MASAGPGGFVNAPVMKGVMYASAGVSILATLMNWRHLLALDRQGLQSMQLWRLFTHHFVFNSMGETIFGLILLYQFRLFERQMGSKKFGAFTVLSMFVSSLVEIASLTLFNRDAVYLERGAAAARGLRLSGPFTLIFSLFVQYWRDVPSTYKFRVLGIPFSDKVITYIMAAQLFFVNPPLSTVGGIAGLIAGVMYRMEGLGLHRFRLPGVLTNLARRVFGPLLYSRPPPRGQTRAPVNFNDFMPQNNNNNNRDFEEGQGYRDTLLDAPGHANQFFVPPQQGIYPTEDNIQALINMGFTREDAARTLTETNNNLQLAINILLDAN
jgi:membrane associated rhomboid family serine protease